MELPLFPLHVVLFPGRPLPLHLFEPRYRRMLGDCLERDRQFGVVAIRSGREVGDEAQVHEVGTIARIESVEELADGRFDVITRGTERFRVRHVLRPCAEPDGAPYLRGEVDLLAEPPADPEVQARAAQLRRLLAPYLLGLGAPEELIARLPVAPAQLAYLAAAAVQVEIPEQQRLLELATTGERLDATLALLRRETGLMRHIGTVGSLRPPGPGGAQLN
jgi:uncharacterized protein